MYCAIRFASGIGSLLCRRFGRILKASMPFGKVQACFESRFVGGCPNARCDGPDSVLLLMVQDGHFVPNLTIGEPVIKSLRKHTDAFLDCHLMVTNPADYVEPLAKAGASSFSFHLEAAKDDWRDLVKQIKASGMKAAVALKPGTPIEDVYPLVESEDPVDMVLVMTVNPGFGGQKFMPDMMPKVKDLRTKYPHLDIQVDGGLGPSTIDEAAAAGANVIVAGSSVFGNKDPAGVIQTLRTSVEREQTAKVY